LKKALRACLPAHQPDIAAMPAKMNNGWTRTRPTACPAKKFAKAGMSH